MHGVHDLWRIVHGERCARSGLQSVRISMRRGDEACGS